MSEGMTYQAGDEIQIGGTTITITSRRGSNGIRYSWFDFRADMGAEIYFATIEEAVNNATRTLAAPTCQHGGFITQFCVDCHDSVDAAA